MTSMLRCGFVGRLWAYRTGAMQDPANELPRIPLPRTPVNKAATVRSMVQRRLPQPLLRLRPWRQPDRPLPGLVIHLVGTHILTALAAAVDGPRTALDFDVLGMTLVRYKERPYGGFLLAFFYHAVVVHDGRLGSASASSLSLR